MEDIHLYEPVEEIEYHNNGTISFISTRRQIVKGFEHLYCGTSRTINKDESQSVRWGTWQKFNKQGEIIWQLKYNEWGELIEEQSFTKYVS